MNIKTLNSLFVIVFLALTIAGCSKPASNSGSATIDLGVVEVSNGVETQRDLGGGKLCIIHPTIQQDGNIMLEMKVEESGKVIAWPRAMTASGKPVSISIETISFSLTPTIKK